MNTNQILLAAIMGETMPLNFDTLPLTEAGADATHFVCEMKGGSNANETGVGAGLTGANLDLTRFGTVGAASSDWRAVSANSGFDITSAFADAFIRNAGGFAILWHGKDVGGDGQLMRWYSSSPSVLSILITAGTKTDLECRGDAKFGNIASFYSAARTNFWPASGEFFVLYSVDYTNELAFVGVSVSSTQPTKLTDFDFYSVSTAAQAPIASSITLAANYFGLVGNNLAGAAFSIKSVTAKLGPSVSLA